MNGDLVRRVQRALETFYGLECGPDVRAFVREEDVAREALYVREREDGLDIALVLPRAVDHESLDGALQVVEGVSHFVLVVERARTGLPTTQLELELQAEIDKFVLLALCSREVDRERARQLCARLYERVRFLDAEGTEIGDRYRVANALAGRLALRIARRENRESARRTLISFYRAGQTEKIRLASAA